jgi:DNA-binding NtrC family response regulator
LIVDDDPGARDWLGSFADRLGFDVMLANCGERAIELAIELKPDLVTLDVLLPGISGLETLKELRRLIPQTPVIMLSGHGSTKTIVEAVRGGAVDFLRKPFEPEELEAAFARATTDSGSHRSASSAESENSEFMGERGMILKSDGMRKVCEVVERVADTDITVLIRGESGTGKDLIADLIYSRSDRSSGPMVKVNCAALPSELLESELFGYEKGAFTGALRRKLGKFEIANGGTIFLDEVSEMHANLQAKLLQVLQDGKFSRLGGEADMQVDARVIAATNSDLEQSVRERTFREDLFYRLNVVTIKIPPLRERTDEIVMFTDHFIERYAREFNKPSAVPSNQLREVFQNYAWPGNVRELENLVKRMIVLGSELPVLHELATRAAKLSDRADVNGVQSELDRFMRGQVEQLSLKRIAREAAQVAERKLIEKVLTRTRWNRRHAAEILQISYKALLYKMKDAGLSDRG